MAMDYQREYLMDHYRDPRNYGKLDHPDVHWEETNPLCGDQLALDLQIEGERVTAVRFQGKGCVISQAAASMLTEMIEGRSIQEVIALGKDDILEALDISISPARTKCAFLSLRALHHGLITAGIEKPQEEDADEE